MNEFESILEECVDQIASGESSPEECLLYYPEYADQLEPILYTAALLKDGREIQPSPFLKARIRSDLNRAMGHDPRQKRRPPFFFWRMALNISVLTIVLVMANTLFAQGALPGETLYNWKLASENLWRTVTVDPLGTDLKLSDRRINEYVALNDEERRAQVLLGYNKLLVRFKEEQDESDKTRILTVLKSHQDSLRKVGLAIPELDGYFSGGATETGGEFQIETPNSSGTRPTP